MIARSRRQSSRDADRLARAHRAFLRAHRLEEKRTIAALRPIWPPLIKTIMKRMERAGGHPPVEALFRPVELQRPFNRAMTNRWLRMTEVGIAFERSWIESASGESAKQRADRLRSVFQDASIDPDEYVRSMTLIEMPAAMRTAVADWLRNRQVGVWNWVAASTHSRLQQALAEGLKDGDTTDQLQKRVKASLKSYSNVQARRIARTEATGGMNFGEHLARLEARIEWKEWVATIDMRTRGADPKRKSRFNHYAAHGQKVANLATFVVSGEKLKYPGDSSQGASAGNLTNCRCAGVSAFDPPRAQPGGPTIPPAAAGADSLERRLVPSKATVDFMDDEEYIRDVAEGILGKRPTGEDLASIVGAADTATVTVHSDRGNALRFDIVDRTHGVTSTRRLYLENGVPVLDNEALFIGTTGTGYGREMFAKEIAFAQRWGVQDIATFALKAPDANGYYTWARFGYDGDIPPYFFEKIAELEKVPDFVWKAKRISDMMLTDEGRKFWKEHGISWSGQFDLRSGSYSLRIFKEYLGMKDRESGIQSARREFLRAVQQLSMKGLKREELDMTIDEDDALFAAVFAKEKARRDQDAGK